MPVSKFLLVPAAMSWRRQAPSRSRSRARRHGWQRQPPSDQSSPSSSPERPPLALAEAAPKQPNDVSLAMVCAALGPARIGQTEPPRSAYAKTGASEQRVQELLRAGCCRCKKACHERVSARDVLQTATRFWHLSPLEQLYLAGNIDAVCSLSLCRCRCLFTQSDSLSACC